MPLVSVPMTVGYISGTIRAYKKPIALGSLFFIFVHSMIGHKEMRFLFPILPFLPLIFAYAIEVEEPNRFLKFFLKPTVFKKIVVLNSIVLIGSCFWPTRPEVLLQKELWKRQDEIVSLYVRDIHPYVLADHTVEYLRPERL
jgi:phosphatidylinositol glycan class B